MLKKILMKIKIIKRTLIDIPSILLGFIVYILKKTTPPRAHQSLINLFCMTGGLSNSLFSLSISLIHRPYDILQAHGVLGELNHNELYRINKKLKEEGYYVFEQRLPEEVCEKLLAFTSKEKANIRGDTIKQSHKEIYISSSPLAVRYDYDQKSLINNEEIQKLMTDLSIIAVAQQYLQAKPILDVIGMWWHTAYQKEPDSSAAQYFHFDMDRIKWLKFFIYLTDVRPENGPTVFVKGSHKNNGIPYHLRSLGYARLSDEQILSAYPKENIIYQIAKRGTIIAEDTRGLHKGQHVEKGDRLVFQLQFSNHLFGADYTKEKFTTKIKSLDYFIEKYPRIYSNYL